MAESIHQEIRFQCAAERIYEALLDAKQFREWTGGAPAEISRVAGGEFSCFGGIISGRNIELVTGKLIVQAWRVKMWPDGKYSLVNISLKPEGSGTLLVLDHVGFPDEMRAHLNGEHREGGWYRQYWEPLQRYLA